MSTASLDSSVGEVPHVTHRLFDGREIVFFSHDRGQLPVQLHDPRPPADRAGHGHLRQDPLTGDWIALATHRQNRTHLPPADQCPLCPMQPGRETEIPADFDVVAFENRFPSLGPELVELPGPDTPPQVGVTYPAGGRCEVLVFTPEHEGSLAGLDPARVQLVIRALAQRTRALSALPGIKQVFPFENRGEQIGTTLHHPHGQIYAYPYVTPTALKTAQRAAEHLRTTGRTLHQDLLEFEQESGERMITSGEYVSAYVPWAGRWPLEVHVVPHRHVPDLAALEPAELDELATVVQDVLTRLDALYPSPTPYIAAWHQAPLVEGLREASRLHLQIVSPRRAEHKLKFLAGSEAAMGAFIGDVSPEETAARLRSAI
ncbi:galactose-1-phosphate uridylyltransferase [Kocuria sp.]|uniref:galactose-1-phosphate uridylyltransferase n=1 Tax=Kocuria sp. TaxID=1871328 RepID=UPI0026E0BF73|nr:galactose-1-phosphate uridylyltransferase [Kocuria sp.]MDO5618924.1 galactose-1-phosphate uridylyltransferase [Kocuria sp.]